jgi:hypothetical protein
VLSIQDRTLRSARLDSYLYEGVEADDSSLGQALGMVVSFAGTPQA